MHEQARRILVFRPDRGQPHISPGQSPPEVFRRRAPPWVAEHSNPGSPVRAAVAVYSVRSTKPQRPFVSGLGKSSCQGRSEPYVSFRFTRQQVLLQDRSRSSSSGSLNWSSSGSSESVTFSGSA